MSGPHSQADIGLLVASSEGVDMASTDDCDDCAEFEIGPVLDALRGAQEALGAAARQPARDGVGTPRTSPE